MFFGGSYDYRFFSDPNGGPSCSVAVAKHFFDQPFWNLEKRCFLLVIYAQGTSSMQLRMDFLMSLHPNSKPMARHEVARYLGSTQVCKQYGFYLSQ